MADSRLSGKRRWLLGFAVALPVCTYVGSIALAEAKRRGAPSIEVKIEGYDPRDPFRGQYLQYRIAATEWGDEETYRSQACAASTGQNNWLVYLHNGVDVPGDCPMTLPVDFIQEPHRFYIQQDRGRELEEALRDGRASVRLRVVNPRYVMVEDLLVDGRPIR